MEHDEVIPQFMAPLALTKKGDKLYFPRDDFAFIREGESRETMKVHVYMRKEASGMLEDQGLYILVERIDDDPIFQLIFPEYCYFSYADVSKKNDEAFFFVKTIEKFLLSNENIETEFDPTFFDNYIKQIEMYIDGPFFFINKGPVDKKLKLIPEILIEHMSYFETREYLPSFLEEQKLSRKNTETDMIDGPRRNYKLKMHDIIISVIMSEIESDLSKANQYQLSKKTNEVNEQTLREELEPLSTETIKQKFAEAQQKEEYEKAKIIKKVLDERGINNGGGLYHPFFIVLTLFDKYL